MISLIVAASTNNVIGAEGRLPWRLSADLRRFRALTMGKPVIMGRKTRESIGRSLPGRNNIVLSRQPGYSAAGCKVVASAKAAIAAAGDADEVMVIGGSGVYATFLPLAERIYLTRVHMHADGDACFPVLDEEDWVCLESETCEADAANDYATTFRVLEREMPC